MASAMKPMPHDDSLQVPKPPKTWSLGEADEDATMQELDVEKDTELDFELFTSVNTAIIK